MVIKNSKEAQCKLTLTTCFPKAPEAQSWMLEMFKIHLKNQTILPTVMLMAQQ